MCAPCPCVPVPVSDFHIQADLKFLLYPTMCVCVCGGRRYGVLVVGDSPVVGGGVDLRRGNRVQLLVRDPKGVREDLRQRLLDYKRRDLASMLEGRALPPTFGTLLLTGMGGHTHTHTHTYTWRSTSAQYGQWQ